MMPNHLRHFERHTMFETQADKAKKMLNLAAREFALLCRNVSSHDVGGRSRVMTKYTNELLWWQKQFSDSVDKYLEAQTSDMKHHARNWAGK